jgi:hypothetical protein
MACDWIHWQKDRNLTDSALARYVARGRDAEQLARLFRCPSDHFEDRLEYPGFQPGQGPYLYSYSLNSYVAENRLGGSTKLVQWKRCNSRRVLLSECMDQSHNKFNSTYMTHYPVAGWGIASVISRRHGTVVFGGDVPGFAEMRRGVLIGTKASTFFMDGHTEPIEADYSLDPQQMQTHTYDW